MKVETAPRWETSTAASPFDRVGHTPLLRLRLIERELPEAVEIYAKAEWHNPSGSVKDRPAAWILKEALAQGQLGPDRPLLDSTSGNMGIAYATLAAVLGLRVHLAIPANANRQRLAILRALGAELTLTDPSEGTDGARQTAAEIVERQPGRFFYADQYSHPANWRSHFESTGPEIAAQTEGRFRKHFDKSGKASETLLRSQAERLENWRLLQEMAGIVNKDRASRKSPALQATGA